MRNYIKIASLLLCVVAMTACDNFLDIQPVGKVIPRTAKEFREMLTQSYSALPDDRSLSTFRSDELVMDGSLTANDLNSYKDIWSWNDFAPNENTAAFNWRRYYQSMFIANYTIESKDIIEEGTADVINQMVGESYMMRAYVHFLLVNLYGAAYTHCDPATTKGIPLKLNSDTEQVLTRNTVAEVYQSILSDLNEAEKYLNVDQWDLGYNYRFTTLSVNALRSRVYLYMGDWKNALTASQKVLNEKNELVDLVNSSTLPNEYSSVESIVALETSMVAQHVRAAKVATGFWKMYVSGDSRRTKYYKQVTASNIQILKGGSNQYACSFRVGEIYLNAAEAACQNGEATLADARTLLLALMAKRYSATVYANKENAVNAMSKEELLTEIYDERARELAFEGHRWFDLRRTTQPQLEKKFGNDTFILQENDERYTIRIPSDAIEANPGLAN